MRDNNVLLVDAMNLIHRSYFAYPRLTTQDGTPTGAIFALVKYMKSLQEKFKPEHIIVCSDAHSKIFRTDFYLYDMLLNEDNREKLKNMLINAKKNLIMEDAENEDKIKKIEEKHKELWKLLS